MRKHSMDIETIIDELIELSYTKYSLLKVGQDTLQIDVLFVEKYEQIKDELNNEKTNYPSKIKELQDIIKKIDESINNKKTRNLMMNKATNAYKK